jgi:immunity protein, SdpI family
MRKLIPGLAALIAAAGFSLWAYPQLPAQVATHFDLDGSPNGWSSRLVASILVPAIGLFLVGVFTFAPRLDPRRANYALFSSTYWIIVNAVLVLMGALHILMLGKALGWAVDMTTVVGLGVGGLFILLGNLMTRIRPNWFVGIRTPWTLSSDTVWRKTHRFGGIAFAIAGVCIAATALVHISWMRYAAFGVAAAAVLGSVIYSYLLWKREQDAGEASEVPAKP